MKIFSKKPMAIVLAICGAGWSVNGSPAARPAETNVVDVFVLPSNPKEGRDPFFPESMRPYEVAAAAAQPRKDDITSLVVKGFSGELTNRLVIINNHTFAAGDEGDVIIPGGRIHLRCLEIKTNSVVIEVGGQRHELFYSKTP